MAIKRFKVDKELKKAQKKGIYNPKVKFIAIMAVALLSVLLGTTYAIFSSTSDAFSLFSADSMVAGKKIIINVTAVNGSVDGENSKSEVPGKVASFKVTPESGYEYDSIDCTYSDIASYDKSKNTLNVTTDKDTSCTIRFKVKDNNLRNKIIASNTLKTETPNFSIGEPNKDSTSASGFYKTVDNEGDSYYFRGAVNNNYISFANKTWRIVRINGDGSIRIVLDGVTDQGSFFNTNGNAHKYVGYTYDNERNCTIKEPCLSSYDKENNTFTNDRIMTNSTLKTYLEDTWYKENLREYDDYIAIEGFCNDTLNKSNYYAPYYNLENNTPDLVCQSQKDGYTMPNYGGYYELKIGVLTMEEYNLAGIGTQDNPTTSANYLYHANSSLVSMSPSFSRSDAAFIMSPGSGAYIGNYAYLGGDTGNDPFNVSPVINLKADTEFSNGDGSKTNPYVVGN